MSTGTAGSCGTHPGLGPFPSDPDNNLSITAQSVFGGIRVSWTYPTINAEAVAYVKLFRSTSSSFASASQHASVKGDNFFDGANVLNSGTTYYYWIQTVSLNKTVGSPIGPASAIASSTVGQLIDILSGEISAGMLAASLRSDIEDIPSLRDDLVNEETNRLFAIEGLTQQLAALGIDVTTTVAAIVTERTLREDGDNVLASQVEAVVASNGTNFAAILTEQTARVSAIDAIAQQLLTLGVDVAGNQAAITLEQTARADGDSAEAQTRLTLAALVNTNFAAFQSEQTARATAESAFAQDISNLEASVVTEGEVQTEISAQITENNPVRVGFCIKNGGPENYDHKASCEANGGTWLALGAIADVVKGVQINDVSGSSVLEQHMSTYRDELDNLNAEYTVKVQVDGNGKKIVGGFGIFANGATQEVEAGFDVDKFWIGKLGDTPGEDNYPFIVDSGNVYMRSAYIQDLTVDTIKIKNNAVSITDFTQYNSSHAFVFGNSGSSTLPVWKHHSQYVNDGTLEDLIDGSRATNLSDFSWASMGTPNNSGESYTVLVHVVFELGIKTKLFNSDYGIIFNPTLEYTKNSYSTTQLKGMPKTRIQSDNCSSSPFGWQYSFSTTVPGVGANEIFAARLKDNTSILYLSDHFGANQNANAVEDNNVMDYCFINNISYTFTLMMR